LSKTRLETFKFARMRRTSRRSSKRLPVAESILQPIIEGDEDDVSVSNDLSQNFSSGSSTTLCEDERAMARRCGSCDAESRTTVMVRNVPVSFTTKMLVELLDNEGFDGAYDFVYVPADFVTAVSFGYSIINFVEPSQALRFRRHFEGLELAGAGSAPTAGCVVSWNPTRQGLNKLLDRYSKSPAMAMHISQDLKPAVVVRV